LRAESGLDIGWTKPDGTFHYLLKLLHFMSNNGISALLYKGNAPAEASALSCTFSDVPSRRQPSVRCGVTWASCGASALAWPAHAAELSLKVGDGGNREGGISGA
jgi:hypothetical protein